MCSSLSRYVICYLYRLIHTCIVLCFVLLRLFWMKKWWNICYFMQVSPGVMELAYKYHATYLSYIKSVGGCNGRGVDLAAGGHTSNGCYFENVPGGSACMGRTILAASSFHRPPRTTYRPDETIICLHHWLSWHHQLHVYPFLQQFVASAT